MPITQCQDYCRHCRRPTLHTREIERVNHILHLLITLFLLGLWLPIWILLALTRKPYPWQCSHCGLHINMPTMDEMAANRRAYAEARAEKAQRRAERAQAARDASAAAMSATAGGIRKLAAITSETAVDSIHAADDAMARIADDDRFMHQLMRVLAGGIGAGCFAIVLTIIVRTIF